MIKVEKCCLCVRLSNFAIILGSIYSFLSITLVLIIGSFLLNYDNLTTSFYEKEDFDSVRIATFLEKWKNGKGYYFWNWLNLIKILSLSRSCGYDPNYLYKSSSIKFHELIITCVWNNSCKTQISLTTSYTTWNS